MSEPYLSVVIPAYNEEARLPKALDELIPYLRGLGEDWELVVVDDGSRDKTADLVRSLAAGEPRVRLVSLERNRGKGEAVRQGMLAARGRFRLFRDADCSTAMAEFSRFKPLLEAGTPVVIGSRRVRAARFARRQPWLRETLGKGFTLFCRFALVWEVVDYTCGFKAFTAAASQAVFSRQRIERWGYDAEILFIAKRLGFEIAQVPVTWADDPASKVRLAVDILGTFKEIAQIRLNSLLGRYA